MLARGSESRQTGAVYGVGIDVVEVVRMRAVLRRWGDGFVQRVFTSEEQIPLSAPNAAAHFAARFAVKEAFLKALGTGLTDGIRWRDVSTRRTKRGAPVLRLAGRAAELRTLYGVGPMHLSLSHGRASAAAVVMLERAPD